MNKKINTAFLLLVLTQAVHSIEEYYGRLWEVYAPAKFITSLVSTDHERGFVVINISLFLFGIVAWFAAWRNYSFAIVPVWFLTCMEIINSIGHTVWAMMEKNYVPGIATAPVLFIVAIYIIFKLFKTNYPSRNSSS